MKYVKNFKLFLEGEAAPAPVREPETKPKTKPGEKPKSPSPIRRDEPKVKPAPKAKLEKATSIDVVKRFAELLKEEGESLKNYKK